MKFFSSKMFRKNLYRKIEISANRLCWFWRDAFPFIESVKMGSKTRFPDFGVQIPACGWVASLLPKMERGWFKVVG